jgi:hypothetical protein
LDTGELKAIEGKVAIYVINYFHSSPLTARYQLLEQQQYHLNVHVEIRNQERNTEETDENR